MTDDSTADTGEDVTHLTLHTGTRLDHLLDAQDKQFAEIRIGGIVVALADPERKRSCDGCDRCCVKTGITELKKYSDQTCKHLVAHRCSIYGERPQVCADYDCGWRLGNFPDDFKPSVCGFMVNLYTDPETMQPRVSILCDEKIDQAKLTIALNELRQAFPAVVVVHASGRVLLVQWDKTPIFGKLLPTPKGQYEALNFVVYG